jgi:hypothetical protein
MVCQWFGLKTTEMISHWFGPQNQWQRFVSETTRTVFTGLASKPVVTVSSGLTSKPVATVSNGLASKPAVIVFSRLASKLVVTVSLDLASKPVVGFLVEPQNQGGGGFTGLGLKIGSTSLVIWV